MLPVPCPCIVLVFSVCKFKVTWSLTRSHAIPPTYARAQRPIRVQTLLLRLLTYTEEHTRRDGARSQAFPLRLIFSQDARGILETRLGAACARCVLIQVARHTGVPCGSSCAKHQGHNFRVQVSTHMIWTMNSYYKEYTEEYWFASLVPKPIFWNEC